MKVIFNKAGVNILSKSLGSIYSDNLLGQVVAKMLIENGTNVKERMWHNDRVIEFDNEHELIMEQEEF
jgi:hypothetical protein